MITKAQVQITLDLIDKKYKELVKGNTVKIHESDFNQIKIYEIDEQIQILDFLQDDRGCIEYSIKKDYKSVYDIDLEDIRSLKEASIMGGEPFEELIDDMLGRQSYMINVLKTFSTVEVNAKYKLTFIKRRLELNGVLIAKPDSFSENDEFLSFIFNDGGHSKRFRIDELKKSMGVEKLAKTPHQILTGLNITGEFREMFFPNVSKKGIEFVNPITYNYFLENGFNELDLDKIAHIKYKKHQ